MNNSNFGYDRKNNVDNSFFCPKMKLTKNICNKIYQRLFDNKISDFVSCELMDQKTECEYNNSLISVNINDEFYENK